jgi:SAM-dependent methyltransferase
MSQRPQDLVGAGYDAMHARYAAWAAQIVGDPRERYVARLLSLVPEHPDVLEIGCGAGVEPTPNLAARGRLVGIDISKAQVERARAAIPEVEFIHGDITGANFDAESFDAVVALYVLTHVPSAECPGLLQRIGQWLRPGGVLLATFGGRGPHDSFVDDFLGAPMFFSGFDPETNERLVQEGGLTILESQLEPMQEPESEPGRGPETSVFHWILAQKDQAPTP